MTRVFSFFSVFLQPTSNISGFFTSLLEYVAASNHHTRTNDGKISSFLPLISHRLAEYLHTSSQSLSTTYDHFNANWRQRCIKPIRGTLSNTATVIIFLA